MYHGLYSEAVVSSVAPAVALAEVGRFKEAVQYVQRTAKALYETAKEVFERVKVTVQRLVELFVEAVTRVLAWIDEHKAYLFLMAAAAAGAIVLSAALNLWGLVELEKLAYAASLTPFIPGRVKEHPREEAFNILKNDPDPYEKFKDIAKDANAGRVKLAEPWESLRVLIMPKPSEERRLIHSKTYRELDERKKKALFYAVLALEEAFGVYRSALREVAEVRGKATQRVEVGEEPFKRIMYMLDLNLLTQLAEEEEAAFENALKILKKRLNENAVRYGLEDLLNVEEGKARELAEAVAAELSKFSGMSFGTKASAALMAYREYALGRKGVFGAAAGYWLEVGGSAWLLYYAPNTACQYAERAKVVRPVAVEEMVAEALRRLFLKPSADHYHGFVEELARGGKLALMLEKEAESSYVFKLYNMKESGELEELGAKLRIEKVEEEMGTIYYLELGAKWREFFRLELEAAEKAAEVIRERLPVEDRFPYMLGWVASDVAITGGLLRMGTSHLWQLAETHALFDWSYVTVLRVNLTLEGPKPHFEVYTSLDKLDEAIRISAEGGWLKMLGIKAESWDDLKQWVADHWDEVINMVKRRLEGVKAGSGFDLAKALEDLKGLKSRLNDDKVAREVIAPALLLMQAERLGVNEETLKHFGAVISGAIDGDGHVSAARREVGLTGGEREIALLWKAVFAAHGIEAEVRDGRAFDVVASGVGAARLARLYFRYGYPLLKGDERIINHKLAEAMELGAEELSVSWEGLRGTESGRVAADLIISVGDAAVKYNVYLRKDILLQFRSTDRSRVELAARLLKLAGVDAEVKKEGGRDVWHIEATTDKLAAGREELRKALAEIVETARKSVGEEKAKRWLKKLEKGRVLMEGWPKYEVRLSGSGGLMVRFASPNSNSIKQVAQRLENMGLVKGVHFTVKTEEGRDGYVYIRKEGLAHAAFLSVYGKDEEQRRLAAKFVKHILRRAEEAGKEVYKKAKEIIDEGKAWGSIELEGFKKEVEMNGKTYVVKVKGGEAEIEERQGDKPLLRIRITAEVGGVRSEYTITYSRHGKINAAIGYATARADAPGGREADAERLVAVIMALTDKKPKIRRMKNGQIMIVCTRGHLDGFMRYAELADAIKKWLKETSR